MEIPLSELEFDKYDYEVAFEFRDSGLFRWLFTRKEEFMVYYIRRIRKSGTQKGEEILQVRTYDPTFAFLRRDYASYFRPIYWNNSHDPQTLLMRAYLKLQPSDQNVTFSTKSLSSF